jgi:hypothetical protein
VPPAAVEHPVGTSNIATTPVAAATALMVFLEFFDFIVVPFREGQMTPPHTPLLSTCKPDLMTFLT